MDHRGRLPSSSAWTLRPASGGGRPQGAGTGAGPGAKVGRRERPARFTAGPQQTSA